MPRVFWLFSLLVAFLLLSVASFPSAPAQAETTAFLYLPSVLRSADASAPPSNPAPPAPAPTATPVPVPPPPPPITNASFESGPEVGWSEGSRQLRYPLVVHEDDFGAPAYHGEWFGWLGGINNEFAILYQIVRVPLTHPYLRYWYVAHSTEDYCYSGDKAEVLVNATPIASLSLCTAHNTDGWDWNVVDLRPYAGQEVILFLSVETDTSDPSSIFFDDLAFVAPPISPNAIEEAPAPRWEVLPNEVE